MDNQGRSESQMKASYIGAFIGFVGVFIIFLYAMFT